MPQVVLKTGEVLEGEVIAIGEPRLAVVRQGAMVELEASQIDHIEGVEPGLTLPRGLPRASHYRRVFIDVEAGGRVTARSTVILIGSDADRIAGSQAWAEFLGKEPDEGAEPPWTWDVEFRMGCETMEIQAFDEFGEQLNVVRTGDWEAEEQGQTHRGGVYRMELEVPLPGEWPTHLQHTMVLVDDHWAVEVEPGIWQFQYTQFAGGPRPEVHETYVRLAAGAVPVETSPEATWFPGRRGTLMCRLKHCLFPSQPFDLRVKYRVPGDQAVTGPAPLARDEVKTFVGRVFGEDQVEGGSSPAASAPNSARTT